MDKIKHKKLLKTKEINDRIEKASHLLLNEGKSLREIALLLHSSKSNIHLDLTDRIKNIDYDKYVIIKNKLKEHYRHKRKNKKAQEDVIERDNIIKQKAASRRRV